MPLLKLLCGNLLENEIGVFEELVAFMYDRSTSTNKVNEVHLDLFARKQRPYNGIPPSKAALIEHIKHDIQFGSQTGHNWHQ